MNSVEKVSKSALTRKKILKAFNECVTNTGYAQTKLVDIAEAAGLATPHLRYYFRNKESILKYQYEQIVSGFTEQISDIKADTPMAWFESLGHMIFDTRQRSERALLVLIEANSLALSSDEMRKLKHQYDIQTRAAIEHQLLAMGNRETESKAQMIFHFLTGLILNTAFESRKTKEQAVPLFMDFVVRVTS